MLRMRGGAFRLAAIARHRPGRLLCSSRTYITGARNDFENDFEAKNSAKRRTELQAFLAVLRPDETAALATQGELERVMSPFARGGYFASRADLADAVRAAQDHLASAEATSLVRSLPAVAEPAATEPAAGEAAAVDSAAAGATPPESSGAAPSAAAAEGGSGIRLGPQHGSWHPEGPTGTTEPKAAEQKVAEPPVVADDSEAEREPMELTEAERQAIHSLRVSLALPQLVTLWERQSAAAPASPAYEMPLARAVEVARTLGGGEPLAALQLELEHAVETGSVPSAAQVREAAHRVVANAQPLYAALLRRSGLLLPKEEARLLKLEASAAMRDELRQQSLWQRLRRMTGSPPQRPEGPAWLGDAAEKEPREARLYAALASEAALHDSLATAFFACHDRWTTRRRRAKGTAKYLGLFVSLNMLDFLLTNA
jgi:hypothetical protein